MVEKGPTNSGKGGGVFEGDLANHQTFPYFFFVKSSLTKYIFGPKSRQRATVAETLTHMTKLEIWT